MTAGPGSPGRLRAGVVLAAAGLLGVPGAGAAPDAAREPPAVHAYVDGPPPGHTGGFEEPTCQSCHFDAPLNPPEARLSVRGFPDRFATDTTYRLTVLLTAPELGRAGFEAALRCADGERAGRQAGRLAAPGGRAEVVRGGGASTAGDTTVLYARQTEQGSRTTAPDTAVWRLTWTPGARPGDRTSGPVHGARAADGAAGPDVAAGGRAAAGCPSVVLHAAANAANGDASEFGDRVLTGSWTARPAGGDPAGR